jgi:hypothetical protein
LLDINEKKQNWLRKLTSHIAKLHHLRSDNRVKEENSCSTPLASTYIFLAKCLAQTKWQVFENPSVLFSALQYISRFILALKMSGSQR